MENEDLDRILKEAEADKPAEKPEEKEPEEKQDEKVEEEKPAEQEKKEEVKPVEKSEEKELEAKPVKKQEEKAQEKKEEKKLDFYVVGPDGTRFDQMPGESEDDVRERANEYYDGLRESDGSENADVATPSLDNSDLEKDEPVKAADLKPAEDNPIDRDGEVTPGLDNKDMKEDGDKESEDLQEFWKWGKRKEAKTDSKRERDLYNAQKKDYEKTEDEKDRVREYDRRANIEIGNRLNDKEDAERAIKYRDYYANLAYKNAKKRIKDELHYGLGSHKERKEKYKEAMAALRTKGKDLVRSEKEQARRDADKYSQAYSSALGAYAKSRDHVKLSQKSYDDVRNDVNKELDLNKIAKDKDIRALTAASEAPSKASPEAPKANAEKPSTEISKPEASTAIAKQPAEETKDANADQAQKAQGAAIAEEFIRHTIISSLLENGIEPTQEIFDDMLDELYNDAVAEDALEINPEVANADDKFEDGVAEPIGDDSTESVDTHEGNDASETADNLTAEVDDIMDSDPVKQTEKAPEDGNDEFEDIAESLNSILDMLKEEESVKMPEPPVDKKPEESHADLDNKDMKEDGDKEEVEVKPVEIKEAEDNASELSIADMVSIVTEAAYNIKSRGEKATYDAICEEAEKICDDPEHKEFNIDAVLNSEAGAEIGTCENDKDIAKADDLHEDAEEIKPEEAVKEVKAEAEKDEVASSEDVEPAPVLETDNYSSIKEACMLGEYYFNTDSYTIDTPEAKSNKLVEQISLLIAREHNDPLYNELLKEAVYTNRLHEAVTKKYKNEAVPKAEMITKKKELCESLSLDELNEDAELNEGAVGRWFTRMAVRMMTEKALNKCLNKAKEKAISSSKTPEERKAISDKVDEIMALPKKEKKQKLIELCKKAPEKDQDAAERKLKAVMNDSKAKSELTEEADGLIDVANKALDGADVTLTARNAMAILNNNAIIIILSIVTGLLAAGLIAVIAYNLNKALKGNL